MKKHKLNRFFIFSMQKFFLLFSMLLFASCQYPEKKYEKATSKQVQLGIDPDWFPLDAQGQEGRLLAFSTELFTEIGKKEKLFFSFRFINSDSLKEGLEQGKYQAILAFANPIHNYQKKFAFSDSFLWTGPSLITRSNAQNTTLASLKEKEIGFIQGASIELFLQQQTTAILRPYENVIDLLNAIETQDVDAGVLDLLLAQNYVHHLYARQLELQKLPLTEEGLYFQTLSSKSDPIISKINQGLKELKKKGEYQALREKWGLYQK